MLLRCIDGKWLVFSGAVLNHKLKVSCMKGNAKQYSKGGKAEVQYYRLLLHTCTEFPLHLVELNYPSGLGLDNL